MTTRSRRFVQVVLSIMISLAVCGHALAQGGEAEQTAGSEAQQNVGPEASSTPTTLQTPTVATQQAATEPSSAAAGTYVIKQGDTLWDISSALYRDPFLWPLIWKANPGIADPDLIFPGVSLVIPSLAPVEQAIAEPLEQAAPQPSAKAPFSQKPAVESAVPKQAPQRKLVLPAEAEPPLLDKYEMLSLGFIGDEPSKDTLLGAASESSQTLLGYEDEVNIAIRSRQDVKVGDLFVIYRPDHVVKHPVTGRSYGPLNLVMGIVKVTIVRENGIETGRIVMSFDAATSGDLLTPYQEPKLIYPSKEKQTKDLSGYILDVRDSRSINAQYDIIYLDKGKADGVDLGDRFSIVRDNSGLGAFRTVARAQVYLVRERTSTAIIRKSREDVGKGDSYQSSN